MSRHRLDDPDEPLFPVDLEHEREFLSNLEKAWLDGSLAALLTAVSSCAKNHRPLPKWANEAVLTLLEMPEKKRRGRLANAKAQDRQNQIDFVRHQCVALRQRTMTWREAYDEASHVLRGTFAQGSARAMEDTYKKVQRHLRRGAGWRYYVW